MKNCAQNLLAKSVKWLKQPKNPPTNSWSKYCYNPVTKSFRFRSWRSKLQATKLAKILGLLLLSTCLTVGCQSKDHGNNKEAESIKAQKLRLNQLTAELEKANKDLSEQKENAKEIVQWLNREKGQWENNRNSRELQLMELTKKIAEESALLERTKINHQEIASKITEEKKAILLSLESLEQQKEQTKREILALKLESDAKVQKAQEQEVKAELKMQDLNRQQAQLTAEQMRLSELDESLKESKENLERLNQEASERQQKLQLDIILTRELFAKEGLGDALAAIEGDLNTPFLITIVGQGRIEFKKLLTQKIMASNQNRETPLIPSKLSPSNSKSAVGDQFIISSTGPKIRRLRDSLNEFMSQKNKEGYSVSETSLYVIVRPIQKIRTALKISIYGSEAFSTANQPAKIIAEMTLPSSVIKWDGTSDLDLNQPSTYAFSKELNESCAKVNAKCIEALRKLNWLEESYSLNNEIVPESSKPQLKLRDLLSLLLKVSIDQIAQDQVRLKTEQQPWLQISQNQNESIFNRFKFSLKTDEIANSIFPGDRYNVIHDIKMSYVVKLVDPINSTGNPLDTFRYLFDGYVGNYKLVSTRKSRDEIEIELPIPTVDLMVGQSPFPDLTMNDWKFEKVAPIEPKNDTSKWYKDSPAKNKYDADLAAWENQKEVERRSELMKRMTVASDLQMKILNVLK